MKHGKIWSVLRRSWRTTLSPVGSGTPVRAQTGLVETALLNSALQALDGDDVSSLLQSACQQLRLLSGADCTSLVLTDEHSGAKSCHVAAADGWPDPIVGVRVDLPLRPDAALSSHRSDKEAGAGSLREPPLYRRHGLSDGLWIPVEQEGETIGWFTAHTRQPGALDRTSGSVGATLARIVGAALRHHRTLQDLRGQAIQARALAQQLPVLWMCIDGRSGTLLECNAAIGSWLGRMATSCIGKPAADFFETQDLGPLHEALCRPLVTGAEIGQSFRLKHRNGSLIDCVCDGAPLSDEAIRPSGAMRVLWVFHERRALRWEAPRSSRSDDDLVPQEFDWALECERERREQSLRLLHSLRQGLDGLRALIDTSAQSPSIIGRIRACLDQAWQASEKGALALAAPEERIVDLLSALQRLAEDISEGTPSLCVLECSGPVVRLSAKAKLAAFRTARELLLQMLNELNTGRIRLQLDTTVQGLLRLRLARQVERDSRQIQPHIVMNPVPHDTLGLFAAKTMLAGVGGMLTISPGQHGIVFAEFQIPLAAPVVTGEIVRING